MMYRVWYRWKGQAWQSLRLAAESLADAQEMARWELEARFDPPRLTLVEKDAVTRAA